MEQVIMRSLAFIASATLAAQVHAAPNVVVDIAPLHGLVSDVMAGVALPTLLLPPHADAHSYAMRPSDAQALADATVVIWVGAGLTPWLEAPLQTLTPNAAHLALLDTDGWTPREIEGHGHGEVDPHAWLDPKIAAVWVGHIEKMLAGIDPENAASYAENADALRGELAALDAMILTDLAELRDRPLIWPHAAYGYFQDAYGLTSAGAISETDAAPAGPQHIAELRDLVVAGRAVCVLSDAEVSAPLLAVVRGDTDVNTARIDPIGAGITAGAGQYQALLTQMSQSIAGCLTP